MASGEPLRTAGRPSKLPPAFMTKAEYARHRGVSPQAVHKAIRDGRIRTDRRGRIEWAAADLAWSSNSEPTVAVRPVRSAPQAAASPRSGASADGPALPPAPPVNITYSNARAMREYYQAELAKLELGERSGSLLSADDVRDAQFRAARAARDLLLSIPDRVGDVLATTDDAAEVRRILGDEILRACQQLGAPAPAEEPDE